MGICVAVCSWGTLDGAVAVCEDSTAGALTGAEPGASVGLGLSFSAPKTLSRPAAWRAAA